MCDLIARPGRQVNGKCELFTLFEARFAPMWRRSIWFSDRMPANHRSTPAPLLGHANSGLLELLQTETVSICFNSTPGERNNNHSPRENSERVERGRNPSADWSLPLAEGPGGLRSEGRSGPSLLLVQQKSDKSIAGKPAALASLPKSHTVSITFRERRAIKYRAHAQKPLIGVGACLWPGATRRARPRAIFPCVKSSSRIMRRPARLVKHK